MLICVGSSYRMHIQMYFAYHSFCIYALFLLRSLPSFFFHSYPPLFAIYSHRAHCNFHSRPHRTTAHSRLFRTHNLSRRATEDLRLRPRVHWDRVPFKLQWLTPNLLTTTTVAPPSNASKWQMGFNSAFKGLIYAQPALTLTNSAFCSRSIY
jgi:hypothetical protein